MLTEITYRRSQFGENANEYKRLFNSAVVDFFGAYLQEELQAGGKPPKSLVNASNSILRDLEGLNAQLPKKGKPQINP